MTRSVNKVTLIGNLGASPEVRSTGSGTRVATLSIATNRRWQNAAGDWQDKTEWHRVVCWARLADICDRYLKRGDRVYIEGRIEYRQWEGQDGQTRYTTEINAREMMMLGKGGQEGPQDTPPDEFSGGSSRGGGAGPERSKESEFSPSSMASEDDLPF